MHYWLPPSALLIYSLVFFLLSVVWRALVAYRRTGINPVVLTAGADAYGYVARASKLLLLASGLTVTLIALLPTAPYWLGAYTPLQSPLASAAGWGLLLLALGWLLLAQLQMGTSWRIGIDHARRTPLVTHGLFRLSRNPIYLAMRVNQIGLLLVFPSAATLALLVAGEILMQVQVPLEERHLLAQHGAHYVRYCQHVRRWL